MRYFIIVLLILVSCKESKEKNVELPQQENCSEFEHLSDLLQRMIDLDKLQQYFNVHKVIKQNYLVLEKNSFTNNKYSLDKFDKEVLIITKNLIQEKKIKAFISVKDLTVKGDTANVEYEYKIQGIRIKSIYLKKRCSWELLKSELWEE